MLEGAQLVTGAEVVMATTLLFGCGSHLVGDESVAVVVREEMGVEEDVDPCIEAVLITFFFFFFTTLLLLPPQRMRTKHPPSATPGLVGGVLRKLKVWKSSTDVCGQLIRVEGANQLGYIDISGMTIVT